MILRELNEQNNVGGNDFNHKSVLYLISKYLKLQTVARDLLAIVDKYAIIDGCWPTVFLLFCIQEKPSVV